MAGLERRVLELEAGIQTSMDIIDQGTVRFVPSGVTVGLLMHMGIALLGVLLRLWPGARS
jgi:hypothetical protein